MEQRNKRSDSEHSPGPFCLCSLTGSRLYPIKKKTCYGKLKSYNVDVPLFRGNTHVAKNNHASTSEERARRTNQYDLRSPYILRNEGGFSERRASF